MRKLLITLGLYNVAMVVFLLILLTLNRVSLIIALGIKTTDFLITFLYILLIAAFVSGNLLIFFKNRHHLHKPEQKKPPLTLSKEEIQNPDNLRRDLNRLLQQRPRLADLLQKGLTQMDSIDRKQFKLDDILTRNEVGSLGEVVATIDEAERSICRNLTRLVDRVILWDPQEAEQARNAAVYAEHMERMAHNIQINDNILTQCDVLLSETVSYLDEASKSEDSTLNLSAMTEAVRVLRVMNGKGE